jgi:deoxyribonuclease-4
MSTNYINKAGMILSMDKTKIKLGPAGNCAGTIIESLHRLKELGLDGQEVEFTYGVKMQNSLAKEAGELAKKLGLKLSVHAPYYVNLSSKDNAKIEASKKRILMSCERGHYLGATHIVFHAGFYEGRDHEEIYQIIKKELSELLSEIKKNKWSIKLAPETTGKKSQFGDVDELIRLHNEIGTDLCVDFAHLLARDGKVDYDILLDKLKTIKHLHCHYSGIEYTDKGERKHLVMDDAEIKKLLSALVKHNVDCMIISESPVTWEDSLKMKKMLEKL